MARTFTEIRDAILAEKEAQAELAVLTSSSQSAVWRLWVDIIARVLWVREALWDEFRIEVQAIADRAAPGTANWIAQQALKFQFSSTTQYTLTVSNDGVVGYDVVDPAAQIIKYAAVKERKEGVVHIKVAKADAEGLPVQLSTEELEAFQDYYSQIKFPGVRDFVSSLPAEEVTLEGIVYYAPGSNPALVQQAVEQALTGYLKAQAFNSLLYRERVIDVIQAVAGVVSVKVNSLKVGTLEVDRVLELLAGYAKISTANPLSSTLTYAPENA